MLKKIGIFFILFTWPAGLFLVNTHYNFIYYVFPIVLIFVSIVMFASRTRFYFLPLFLIPFISPKLAVLPFLFLIFNFEKKKIIFLLMSLFLFCFLFRSFWGQTIFVQDYEANQKILRQEKLYDSIFLARLFQNKPRVVISKFINNFLTLIDPNNYFFGFAPGQIIIDNQNLHKFPFLSIPFLIMGLSGWNKGLKRFVSTIFLSSIVNLSLLTNFDRTDFVLYLPIAFLIIDGLMLFHKKMSDCHLGFYLTLYYFFLCLFSFSEVARLFLAR